jgi:enamine deaminase RidA (YjgF/YER057c/UK114 family)
MEKVSRVDGNRAWSPIVGYSRAIRRGNLISVSGTSSTTLDGCVMYPHDAYGQIKYILEEVKGAIEELGATYEDTMSTRIYFTNIEDWPAVAKAHHEVFGSILPAATFLEVSRLMLPELCVEFEATLWVS